MRVEYEGAIYHLMNRGDRREDIFRDDEDRQRFLETLEEACEKAGLGGAFLLSDAEPFPFGGGDAAGQSLPWDALAIGDLHRQSVGGGSLRSLAWATGPVPPTPLEHVTETCTY